VPSADAEALGAALRRLLGDNALMRRCGAAARARFEAAFTIEHMAAARRRVWERALGR
jgi:glycosyltransferase involved in cell wall biosynthesis